MKQAEFIQTLCADLAPVSTRATERRFGQALAVGGAVALALLVFGLGIQPELAGRGLAPFLTKVAYAAGLILVAFNLAGVLARPGRALGRRWLLLAAPVVLILILAILDLAGTPRTAWPAHMMGHSWRQCPLRVMVLAAPIFAALCFALRQQAPVRLRATGAVAGLLAGAAAAAIYALACTEGSATFILIWYSLGVLGASAVGALAGPALLRW
jgi:hypothetical protein